MRTGEKAAVKTQYEDAMSLSEQVKTPHNCRRKLQGSAPGHQRGSAQPARAGDYDQMQ